MKKRILSLLLVLALVFPILTNVSKAEAEVQRFAGSNRYDTAIQLSQKYEESKNVVIASGENFPDALAGSGLASSLKAPLILSTKNQLTKTALNEIGRLGAEKAYILGGLGTIRNEALADLNIDQVRVSGNNRYQTSLKIAEEIEDLDGLVVVNGDNFPDALSAGGFVDGKKAVILTNGKTLDLPDHLKELPMTILGGENSVSKDIETKFNAKRIAGSNRYETSLLVSKESGRNNVLVADGTNYPDALSAVTLASKMPATILLTSPKAMDDASLEYANNLDKVVIVGGKNSVSQEIENLLKGIVPEPKPEPTPNFGSYKVVRVVDGDTIIVNYNGKNERVRLIGVDAPESVHPDSSKNNECGIIATNFTKYHLKGKMIGLEFDEQQQDEYGNLLAYVWLDGEMFNRTILTAGMAKVLTLHPNVKYEEEFKELEKIARDNKVGLWDHDCKPIKKEPAPQPTPPANNGKYDPNKPKDGLYESPYPDRLIKGNINSKGEKIYHVPGQRDYKRTMISESKGERWFATEAEARAAGWRKAKR